MLMCVFDVRTQSEVEVVLNRLQLLHHIGLFGFSLVQPPLSVFKLRLQV